MKDTLTTIFGLLGGLAVFIFGMNMMSESLQKVAGDRMKRVLEVLTKNPVMGVLAGALVTAVLQSSSATTVLVIGFVSAGLMSLPQGISVILGANIGTTMTAQLMAFKISNYIWPIVFVGFFIFFIAKNEKVKFAGQTIFAFGLLFVGIETMGTVMKPLAKSPVFVDLMGRVANLPVLGVLLGAGMTLVVQSSSATIAVLQNFASQAGPDGVSSVIGLTGAIPILLGDNIGTTITAILASIGQSKDAKRAAVAHSIFNITGAFVFIWIVRPFAAFVQMISPKGAELDVISRQIANAHMSFNILNTLIWLPLIPLMVKIVMTVVRDGRDIHTVPAIEKSLLDKNVLYQPMAAMVLASKEIYRAAEITKDTFKNLRQAFSKQDSKALEAAEKNCSLVYEINQNTVSYISSLLSTGSLTEEQATRTAGLLYLINDIARISERCEDIIPTARKAVEGKVGFSDEAQKELSENFNLAEKMFKSVIKALENGDMDIAHDILRYRKELRTLGKKSNKNHLKRLRKNNCKPELTYPFSNILHNLERIGDCCGNMAEEVFENVTFVSLWDEKAI